MRSIRSVLALQRFQSVKLAKRAAPTFIRYLSTEQGDGKAPEENKSKSEDKKSSKDKKKDKTEEVEPPPITIKVEKTGNITLIGINRPEVRNCVDSNTAVQLTQAIAGFEEDPDSPVAILYGEGGTFCAGYDLNELQENAAAKIVSRGDGAMGPTRAHTKKPIIAAISGYCVAGGLELALMCDLRIVEEQAVLGFFNRRFGVPLIDGATARLTALIGLSRALDLVLTGRQVSAKEALDMGLANRIVATGAAIGQAVNLASQIAKFPPHGLQHDRASLYFAAYDSGSFEQSTSNELMTCSKELFEEASFGAKRFIEDDVGKSGKFHDIKEKDLPDWEKDEIKREQEDRKDDKKPE